ncbi:hypothetical protein Ciccas_007246 [Cichlidogyrus casuarinus]|uniref:Uncharacterized protein n=1 Tax=Cichlidogyrus casuarinus TaxID=1844966 RepID=A0ABD2Q603_9PLAT
MPQKHCEKTIAVNFLFGGFAGSIAKTVIAPLDRAKIIFQTSLKPYSFHALSQVLKETYQKDGFRSLWRGNTATITRIFPYAATQYSAHEKYKHLLRIDSLDEISKLPRSSVRIRRFLAGAMAGATSVAATYPFDFARARMAVTHKQKYRNLVHVLTQVMREEGISKIYQYRLQQMRKRSPPDTQVKLDALSSLFCGALAGVIGQTITYPLDIVRRRMQTGHVTGHPEYDGLWRTVKLVLRHEGVIKGLYKGVSLNWIKGPIASGISFTIFNQLQTLRCYFL